MRLYLNVVVVICLKNRTFAVSQTTVWSIGKLYAQLWFAWKIVLLQYRKQHSAGLLRYSVCCDLLEKSYFCSIANNHSVARHFQFSVVICLKNRTFAVSQTTLYQNLTYHKWLWFAWKIVLLQYRKQQVWATRGWDYCCDLLEKSYFCSIANNIAKNRLFTCWVVICLKNRTFAVSQTTCIHDKSIIFTLWFAWKIVLLQYRKQLRKWQGIWRFVVICLKNRTFAVSQTTAVSVKTF